MTSHHDLIRDYPSPWDPCLPAPVRFMSKVDTLSNERGCWLWVGGKDPQGYGRFRPTTGEITSAHRWAYEYMVGPIPDGLVLDHLCRIPSCVNPLHLEPVTVGENTRRGLAPLVNGKANSNKKFCPQGHPYDEINTYMAPGTNHRQCRECRRSHSSRREAARTRNKTTTPNTNPDKDTP